jgi:hypothetical protein
VGWRAIAGVAAAVAVVVLGVVVLGGGGGKDDNSSTSGTSTAPQASGTTTTTAKAKPKRAKKRSGREGVRHGHGNQPDRPAPGTGTLLGIADQKAATFSDPLFRKLGVARSRLNTPWNSIFTEPDRLNQWLSAARADGVEPLVAFEHARGDLCPAKPCGLPSVASYSKAVAAFHQRYPWVHLLQPWNEANSATQPTGKRPERAAAYYEAVRRICPNCTITAADVLDGSNLTRWLTRFKAALHGTPAPLWGLHNYSDTNRFRTTGTKRMLSLVPGEIWFTEAGGIVSFTTADGRTALPYDEQRAARAIRFLFRLAALSPRITRTYIYQWKIDFPGNRFDAGLVSANGKPRPSLLEVEKRRALVR